MRTYISGKITGLDLEVADLNFHLAESELRSEHGIYFRNMINPRLVKPLFGIDNWFCHMVTDIWELLACTHIALQPNWIDSRGARIEKRIAGWIGLEVIELKWQN